MKTRMSFLSGLPAVMLLFLTVFQPATKALYAQSVSNEITFDNRSGSQAVVKLVGPTPRTVAVPNNDQETVHVGPGTYYIVVRYGAAQGKYTYSKGRSFNIEESENSYSVITITLHKVVGGNYETRPVPATEFDRQ
jgi:hypothetical protein